jgi:hypothetical protein
VSSGSSLSARTSLGHARFPHRATTRHSVRYSANGVVYALVLPDHDDQPPGAFERLLSLFVALYIACDLSLPIRPIRSGLPVVVGAAVPEATANLHGDLGRTEHYVGGPSQLGDGTSADARRTSATTSLWRAIPAMMAPGAEQGSFGLRRTSHVSKRSDTEASSLRHCTFVR